MSLFSVLGIGVKGMSAAQTGMDLAGQNITNADTTGYSRKRENLAADYHSDGTFGQMGDGVDVINIQRMRDTFIDQQMRDQTQEVGYFTEQNNTLQGVQNVFTEPSDQGLQAYMDQFFTSWQNLANNPADLSARTALKTDGDTLTDVFHNLSTQLTTLRSNCNGQITSYVGQVNSLTKDIYNLNKEIASVEITGQNPNDSLDKRDQDLAKLSKLIDISTQVDSLGQITVTTAGNIIVSPAYQQDIQMTSTTRQLPDGTTVNDVGMQFADSKRVYNPQSGQIRGQLDSRDIVIPEYQKNLDTLANALVSKVNALHETGYTLNGYSGVQFFDPTSTGASDIKLSAAVESDVQNIAAASGGQMLTFTEPGTIPLVFGNAPTSLTHTNLLYNSVQVTAGTTTLKEGVDYHIDYTRGTIQLLNNGYNNTPLNIQYTYTDGSFKGPADNTNAVAIAQLGSSLTMNNDTLGNPTASFTDYYSSFIGKLGLATNEASANLDTRNNIVAQFQTQQDSIAGVSLDDEMADIIKYQHIYAASARLITTSNTMLDSLINM
jgi:flagellar hook-associated protein 1